MRLFKACRSIFRMQLVLQLQCRAAAWAKMLTFIFWGLVHAAMMLIFFRFGQNAGAGINAGMSISQAVAYG
jgi:hypothetical protein